MSEVSEDRDVISFPDPCFLSATSLEVCGLGVKNLWGPCHSLHPASRRGMRAGRPHLLKSLSPKVTHMIYSQVLWVKLVIWPGVLGNVVLHLVAASPKQLFATLSHMAFAIEILSYVTWNEVLQVDLTIVQSSVMLPHRLVFFPSAWWCFMLGLVTSGPQVGCCMCPQTPRTKGNERPPPGNAPCASLFYQEAKNFSRNFPRRLPLPSNWPGLSLGLFELQWKLGTQMSGKGTRTIMIGWNLRVGTLLPGKEERDIG